MVRQLALKRRRDLSRRRWQYIAVGTTLFLGVMLFASSYDAYRNLDASYRNTYQKLEFADMTVTGADAAFVGQVRDLAGVAAVTSREQADIPFRVTGDRTFVGRLVGMPRGSQPAVNRLEMSSGEYFGASHDTVAIAEAHMAKTFALQSGDPVRYFNGSAWRTINVDGVAVSPEYLWPARSAQDVITDPNDFGVLFVPSALVEALPEAMREQQVLIRYKPGADRTALDAQIKSLATRADADSVVTQADQPSNKALQLDVLGFQQMAVAFPVLFLFAAGMATYTLLMRLVYAEREIIGTLRANGLSRWQIEQHYLSYGLLLGLIAGVLGVALGLPLGWALTAEYTAELGIPDTIRAFHPITPVIGILFGVVAGVLASLVPARAAASLDPAVAMRGAVPVGGGRRSLLERVLPPVRRLPARWRMVLRGVSRNPRRSLSTVLGVILALVLLLSAWGLIDTLEILLNRQFTEVDLQDATVIYEGPVSQTTVHQAESVKGVASAEIVQALGVTVRVPGDQYATQLMAFSRGTRMHGFTVGLPYEGVLLGKALRARLGVDVGDTVRLSFGALHTTVDARVAGFVDEPLGTFVYASKTVLQDLLAKARPTVGTTRIEAPDISVVMVRLKPGAGATEVLPTLQSIDGVATVSDARALYRTVQQYMGLFYLFVGMMLAFGSVMAFALVFNTMSVNLAERSAELATMRANGLSRRQAGALLVGENMLLTILAIPPGLLAGYVAAKALMATYSSDFFDYSLHMRPTTFALAALAMIAVSIVSLIPGVRAAGRLDIATLVRERSL